MLGIDGFEFLVIFFILIVIIEPKEFLQMIRGLVKLSAFGRKVLQMFYHQFYKIISEFEVDNLLQDRHVFSDEKNTESRNVCFPYQNLKSVFAQPRRKNTFSPWVRKKNPLFIQKNGSKSKKKKVLSYTIRQQFLHYTPSPVHKTKIFMTVEYLKKDQEYCCCQDD